MRALALLVGALALKAASARRVRRAAATERRFAPLALPRVRVPASATGASAVGALAIGRLEIRKARLREVEIDSLTVRHLKVIEETAGEPNSAES